MPRGKPKRPTTLIVSKGTDRINARRGVRRSAGGGEARGQHHPRATGVRDGVERIHHDQLRREELREAQREKCAHDKPDGGQLEPCVHDEAGHVAHVCAERFWIPI